MRERKVYLFGAWAIGVIVLALFVWVLRLDFKGVPIPLASRVEGILLGIGLLGGAAVLYYCAKVSKR